MRAVVKLEDIGWGGTDKHGVLRPGRYPRPWVARLTGYQRREDRVFGQFHREFLSGQRDFTSANRSGSRGIFLYYALNPGLYEINDRVSWSSVRRYFVRVSEDGTLCEVSREEVIRCLSNADSD